MPDMLSQHFSLEELTYSETALRKNINNMPSADVKNNLKRLCATLEQVRTLLGGKSIIINSGYRSEEVNKAIGGATKSYHQFGLAADLIVPSFGSVFDVASAIAKSTIVYDQLIYEYGSWVHIGLAFDGKDPRRENLSIFKGESYIKGLVEKP